MNGYTLFTRWPSIQRDSEILARRIAVELRLRMLRRNLHTAIQSIERDMRQAA